MSTSQIPVDLKVNVGSRVPSQGPYGVVADNIESVSGETFSDVSSVTAIDGSVIGDAYISRESILSIGEEGCTLSIETNVTPSGSSGSVGNRPEKILLRNESVHEINPVQNLRRSERIRCHPAWQTSGEFVMNYLQKAEPDWMGKAKFLSLLFGEKLCEMPEVCQFIVDMVGTM